MLCKPGDLGSRTYVKVEENQLNRLVPDHHTQGAALLPGYHTAHLMCTCAHTVPLWFFLITDNEAILMNLKSIWVRKKSLKRIPIVILVFWQSS